MEFDIVFTLLAIMFVPSIAINAISWIYFSRYIDRKLKKHEKKIASLLKDL